MNLLLVEAETGDGVEVGHALTAAGYDVRRCVEPGTDRCMALRGSGPCPLATADVDAVIDVRRRPVAFTNHELGSLCALLAQVPLVICGQTPDGPGPWREADAYCDDGDVVAAVGEAMSGTGPTARRRVEAAVATALRPYREDTPDSIRLRRTGSGVDVFLVFSRRLPPTLKEQVRAAVRAALAPLVPTWPYLVVIISEQLHSEATYGREVDAAS